MDLNEQCANAMESCGNIIKFKLHEIHSNLVDVSIIKDRVNITQKYVYTTNFVCIWDEESIGMFYYVVEGGTR